VFTLLGASKTATDYEYSLTFVNSQGNTVTFGPAIVIATNGIRDSTLGQIVAERLQENKAVAAEYDVKAERGADLYFRVILTPKKGQTPKVVKDGVKLKPHSKNLYIAAGVDPMAGDAIFALSGDATGLGGDGEVFLGVNGFVVTVATSDSLGPKTLQEIDNALIGGLVHLGFHGVYQDSEGQIVVPGVSSGSRTDNDVGAAMMTTDSGLATSAQMTVPAAANPRPPRGTVTVSPGRGPAGTTITVSISGFPPNSDIPITLNGRQVGTITTGANGTGRTTFVATSGPVNVPLEVRAAGGNPVVFGYGWFTITPPPK
jgi:hypothetical protein